MLTVMEMMTHPVFKDFRLVSDRSGLNNRIRNTHILDWESEDSLDESFSPGDFVVTTLSAYRETPEFAFRILDALIDKNIAGLAVKDLYFPEIPKAVLRKANVHHIPVFMFSHTRTTDIIIALKNEMAFIEINKTATSTMRKIMYEETDGIAIDILARDINPFFSKNIICAFGIPVDFNNKEAIMNTAAMKYRNFLKAISLPTEAAFTALFFSVGIGIIYSDQREQRDLKKELLDLLEQFSFDLNLFSIGFSDQMSSLSDTGIAAKQSLYAATEAHINNESFKDFRQMGFTKVLCPLRENYWMRSFYEELLDIITEYDKEHDSHIMETVTDYIHCNGDINAAAKISYQHPNTIRYRIKKAQELLNTDNLMDFRIQLYAIVRLREINERLSEWRV